MPTRKLEFPGSRGSNLAARLDTPDTSPRAYAIFAHCFTCSKDILAASRIAEALARLSVTVRPIEQPTVEGLKTLGTTVRPLSLEDGLPDGLTGVVVADVIAGSPGQLAGLQIGDVIHSINDVLVVSPQVCDRLVNEAHGRVRVIIYRSGVVRPLIIESS